jgi:hypothetical protein
MEIRNSILTTATIALFLQGCVTQMHPAAAQVRVIDNPDKYDCEFKGVVTGSASMGWTTAHNAEGAFNDVMNSAAGKGGNAIVISDSDTSSLQSTAVASAYRCNFAKRGTP